MKNVNCKITFYTSKTVELLVNKEVTILYYSILKSENFNSIC